MNDYIIMTDSSADLSQEMLDKLNVKVIPLSLSIDGEEFYNYPDGREISFGNFFNRLRNGADVKTSAINVERFSEYMEKLIAPQGRDILYLGFSSGLSSTYSASVIAANELCEKYPERKIYTVDTLCASLGQGLLVYLAAAEKEKGKSIDEVKAFVESTRLKICHWFTVDDLFHLKKGGRISAATAVVGSALNIKPVLRVDNEGKLVSASKAKGRKASLKALADKFIETAENPKEQIIFISHGDCLEDAETLADMIRQETKIRGSCINFVGPVIGAHTGPGMVALFFTGTQR